MAVQRTLKINELLKRAMSEIIQDRYRDRRAPWMTISRAETSRDLRFCKIYLTVLGDERKEKEALSKLKEDTPRIRFLLGHKVDLRIVPNLEFAIDEDLKEALKVDALIEKNRPAPEPEEEE